MQQEAVGVRRLEHLGERERRARRGGARSRRGRAPRAGARATGAVPRAIGAVRQRSGTWRKPQRLYGASTQFAVVTPSARPSASITPQAYGAPPSAARTAVGLSAPRRTGRPLPERCRTRSSGGRDASRRALVRSTSKGTAMTGRLTRIRRRRFIRADRGRGARLRHEPARAVARAKSLVGRSGGRVPARSALRPRLAGRGQATSATTSAIAAASAAAAIASVMRRTERSSSAQAAHLDLEARARAAPR